MCSFFGYVTLPANDEPVAALVRTRARSSASPVKQWITTRSAEPSSKTRSASSHASRTWTTIGFPRLARQLDVRRQGPQLRLALAVHPEPVEATLPDPHDRRVLQQVSIRAAAPSSKASASWGWMPAEARTPSSSDAISIDRSLVCDVHAHADHPLHAGGLGGLDHDCRFLVHQEQVAVGIHRPGLHREFRVRGAHRAATIRRSQLPVIRGASRETRSRKPHPAVDAPGCPTIAQSSASRRGKSALALVRLGTRRRGRPTPPPSGPAGRPTSPPCRAGPTDAAAALGHQRLDQDRERSAASRRSRTGRSPSSSGVRPGPSRASTAPSRPGTRFARSTIVHTAATRLRRLDREHVLVEPARGLGDDGGEVGLRARRPSARGRRRRSTSREHREHPAGEVPEPVREIGVVAIHHRLPREVAVRRRTAISPHEEVPVGVDAEMVDQLERVDAGEVRLRHLLAADREEAVGPHLRRRLDAGGHQHRRPVDGVEAEDVLADRCGCPRATSARTARGRSRSPPR